MRHDRALLIIGQDIRSSYHHRGEHLARKLSMQFTNVDIVSITKMYDGPGTDPIWKKGICGLRDILFKRIKKILDGNVIHYVVRFPRVPGIFDYLLRDVWMYANLRQQLNKHYDVCILAHPRLALIGLRLKSLKIVDILIYDDWDYYPGHQPGDYYWSRIMRVRERICVRGSDGVVSVSRDLQKLRIKQGAKQSAFIPNGVDYALFQKAQQKTNHPPTLLYMGSLAEPWGADLPINALPIIKREIPEIRYFVLGAGVEEYKLRALVARLDLQNQVFFYGWQNYEQLPLFLAQSDIGIATYRDYDFVRLSRPMKIIEYLAGGLPVISTRVGGEVQAIIEASNGGEIIEFSVEAFACVALDLLSNRIKYKSYSESGIKFTQAYDWDRLFEKEFVFFEQVAKKILQGKE